MNATPKKLIVVVNGQRASGQVHEGVDAEAKAQAEVAALKANISEAAGEAAPRIEVKELLMG